MDWKAAALLNIFAAALLVSWFQKKVTRDLLLFIAGATTLVVGITPAKEFMRTLTDGVLLSVLLLFVVFYAVKMALIDSNYREQKNIAKLFPEDFWLLALAGILFSAAFAQTDLPTQLGRFFLTLVGGSAFYVAAFFLVAIYLVALVLPPIFVLLSALPFAQAALELAMPGQDVSLAGALMVFFSVFGASVTLKARERVRMRVQLPVLIIIFFLCTLLIPQFGFNR